MICKSFFFLAFKCSKVVTIFSKMHFESGFSTFFESFRVVMSFQIFVFEKWWKKFTEKSHSYHYFAQRTRRYSNLYIWCCSLCELFHCILFRSILLICHAFPENGRCRKTCWVISGILNENVSLILNWNACVIKYEFALTFLFSLCSPLYFFVLLSCYWNSYLWNLVT